MSSLPAKPSLGATLPSIQYPLILQVLHRIADGLTETAACKEIGLSITAFRYNLKKEPELQELYAEAMKVGNDVLADTLIDIDKRHSLPAMASIVSKNIQWLLERRNPDKYGARVTINSENHATKGLLDMLDKAIDRIPVASTPYVPSKLVADDVEYEIVDVPEKKGGSAEPPALPPPLAAPTTGDDVEKLLGLRD